MRYTDLLGAQKTFSYAFPTSLPAYDTNVDHSNGWAAFTATQQVRTNNALAYIATVLDLNFVQTTNPASLNTISFSNNNQSDSAGYAQYPDDSFFGSDLFLDNSRSAGGNDRLADGTRAAYVLIHELGHALGLEHPGNYNAGGGGTDAPYLSTAEDNTTWTVMSYTESVDQYHFEYSPLDIAALQYLYGPCKTARTGDDTYQITESDSNFIWDGTGNDLINLSTVKSASTVYLTPGYWGCVGTKSSLITDAGQITVNFGSVIENLIGSDYSDSLYGNEVGNIIDGRLGNDSIEGWDGNDTLNGGLGYDSLNGGARMDNFVFTAGDSGQTSGFDTISDYTKGARGTGDLIDYAGSLIRAISSTTATTSKASVNQTTGVATFALGSGTDLADALADCAAATSAASQFALFRVNGAGNYYMFISDGTAGLTSNDVVIKLVGVTSVASIDLTGGNLTIVS